MGLFDFIAKRRGYDRHDAVQLLAHAVKNGVPVVKQGVNSRVFAEIADNRFGQFETQQEPANDRDFLLAYNRHPWLHAGVSAIARNAAKVPFKQFKLNSDGTKGDEITSGPSIDLMKRPNEFMTYHDMILGTSTYITLSGDSFLEKGSSTENFKQPEALFLIQPSNMTPIPSVESLFAGWNYTVNGRQIHFDNEQIIHFRTFNPLSQFYGTSKAAPLTNTLTIDFFSMDFEKAFFKNGGNVSLLVKIRRGLTDGEFETFKMRMREQYAGQGKAHKIMVVDSDAEVTKIGADPKEALLNDLREFGLREVLAVLGVPRLLVQDSKDVSLANAREQLRVFWMETMIPHLKLMQEKFNNQLLVGFDVVGEFDLSSVEALREDLMLKAQIGNSLIEKGLFDINEARELVFGKEKVSWGDGGRDVLARQLIGTEITNALKNGLTQDQIIATLRSAVSSNHAENNNGKVLHNRQ